MHVYLSEGGSVGVGFIFIPVEDELSVSSDIWEGCHFLSNTEDTEEDF